MSKKIARKSNPRLIGLVSDLKAKSREEDAPIWRDIAKRLEKPTRNYSEVNLSRINRYTSEGETVIVAGKVLGSGSFDHSVNVAALDFSLKAREKVGVKGKCYSIEDIMEENPKGSGIRVIG